VYAGPESLVLINWKDLGKRVYYENANYCLETQQNPIPEKTVGMMPKMA